MHIHTHGFYLLLGKWWHCCEVWRSPVCLCVCCVCSNVCLCLWCCNGQTLLADGRLDDGRLVHTGFLALPLGFLSPLFLSSPIHIFLFIYPSH